MNPASFEIGDPAATHLTIQEKKMDNTGGENEKRNRDTRT